jgi:uncharacterized coiled-coil DUF342 family protein
LTSFYGIINAKLELTGDAGHLTQNIEELGWDGLVNLKRKLSDELKDLTDKVINIDRNQMQAINNRIREKKNLLDTLSEKAKKIRSQIDDCNSKLLITSQKVAQAKDFLSMMESRIPAEKQEDLLRAIEVDQKLIEEKQFKGERGKGEILSRIKEATMKLEAIKAIQTIKSQQSELHKEATAINDLLKILERERESIRQEIAQANSSIDMAYESKRQLASERALYLERYDHTVAKFDAINSRLDAMASMRKKQMHEYGPGLPQDALFKVKEMARKKLESGSKLSFDELKLLYNDND